MNPTLRPIRNNRPVARELEKMAEIGIWWDIDNCPVPESSNRRCIVDNFIQALRNFVQALRQADFQGEISIFTFGNSREIDFTNRAGLTLTHVPVGGGNEKISVKMISHMLFWAYDNPAPRNVLAISEDTGFWDALARLGNLGYTTMLASEKPTNILPPMDIVWQWSGLLNGEPPHPIQDS